MEVYKPVIKKFLGNEVRTVIDGYKEYIVLKDMFSVLGKLDKNNQIDHRDRDKLNDFLELMNKESDRETFPITSKGRKQSREIQEVDCLLIDTVPIVLTQFKPTARRGEQAYYEWIEFMKWVDNLLREHEAYKVILKDKEEQKTISKTITDETDGKMVIVNTQISRMMAELIGVYPNINKINKDELKIYQPNIVIDLIELRQEALKLFEQTYLMTEDYKRAYDFTLTYLRKIYKL